MTNLFGVNCSADLELAARAETWLSREVGCVFGRREFARGRYMIALVGEPEEFAAANAEFLRLAANGQASACLYIYRDWQMAVGLPDVASAAGLLRCRVLGAFASAQGQDRVSQSIALACPVTGIEVIYSDFDLVGFYPQAVNEADPLYDPSNHAPFVCINQASDLYGFSKYAGDMIGRLEHSERTGGADFAQTIAAIRKTVPAWNSMAERTISHFGRCTNPERLCPARVSADRRHYVTPHDESEFAEAAKRRHISEMPVVYVERIIEEWLRCFEDGGRPRFTHVIRPAICPEDIDREPVADAPLLEVHTSEHYRAHGTTLN